MPPVVVDSRPVAALVLADGTIFRGRSIGVTGETLGEVVFNTAMTGYQEILTDPSYAGQIVTLTYPHIGNTGVNDEDVEAVRVHAAGLVIRDLPLRASNFRAQCDLRVICSSRASSASQTSTRASSPGACAKAALRQAASSPRTRLAHWTRKPSSVHCSARARMRAWRGKTWPR